jgi:DNA-binding NarL/FixJ family response regulator
VTAGVLIADDHVIVRQGLRLILDAQPDLEVVAEAGDGAEAVERGLDPRVDLAILDVSMPQQSGLHAAAELSRRRADLRLLVLSMYAHPSFLYEALKSGASGYVLKSSADQDLVEACRAALRGESFLYPDALAEVMRDFTTRADDPEAAPSNPLTARETQVVQLIAQARTTNQIALELAISPRTVERHRENVLAKLGMRDRVELTRYAIRWGLIEP